MKADLDNLFRLRVFVEVADTRSFSRAAERLFLSQPAVSNHIRRLERTVGASLFESRMRNLTLSEAGRSVYESASELLTVRDAIEARLTGAEGQMGGHLVVDADGAWEYFLPELLATFQKEHPQASIEMRISPPRGVYEALIRNAATLGFSSLPTADARIEALMETEYLTNMLVVASRDHPILQHKAPLAPEVLERYPFIYFSAFQPGTHVAGFLEMLGVRPTYALELSSVEAIKRAVTQGVGISLLAEIALQDGGESSRLAQIPIDGPPMRWTLVVAHRRNHALSPLETALVSHVRSHFPRG